MKYFLFGNLYFSEGLESAIIWLIVPLHLEELGFLIPTITLVAGIAIVPWVIKFVWGGIVDYFIVVGRKKFIVLGALLSIGSLVILSFINPNVAIIAFTVFLFISHLGIVFLDVSADAWAIEISAKHERGKVNGAMMAGNLIGFSLGVILFSYIYEKLGYSVTFLMAGLLVGVLILFPLWVQEKRRERTYEGIGWTLVTEFKKKTTILIAVFGFVLVINRGLHMYVVPLFEKTVLNLDFVQIGALTSSTPLWAVPGVIVGGFLSDKFGRKKVLYFFIVLSVVFSASLIFIETWEHLFLYGPVLFSYAGFITVFAAMAMDVTNPRVGATQFSIFMSIANLGEWLGATVSGLLVASLGFARVFLYSAWVLLPGLVVLYFIDLHNFGD